VARKKKIRIGLIFGGRSGEHEVSIASARSVMENLDPEKYEVVPIGITREGSWLLGTTPAMLQAAESGAQATVSEDTPATTAVTLTGDPSVRRLIPIQGSERLHDSGTLDVIFPVMHGTYGEDGALQGLLEMANVPYVGCGVLGAALGMDKEKMKMIFQSAGLPIVDYLVYRRHTWERSPEAVIAEIEQRLSYPSSSSPSTLDRASASTRRTTAKNWSMRCAWQRNMTGKLLSSAASTVASWNAQCSATMS
jgi:D-alanine-D-alanine ligase